MEISLGRAGLHSLGANLNTLAWALKVVKPGGWIVIEDISRQRLKPFDLVEHVLGGKDAVLDSFMVECGDGKPGHWFYLYVLQVDNTRRGGC